MSRVSILASILGMCLISPAVVRGENQSDFSPDPKSVQRYGPAYRYPQAGWIVLHIEGDPYERGYQHGRLPGPEIPAPIRCFATVVSPPPTAGPGVDPLAPPLEPTAPGLEGLRLGGERPRPPPPPKPMHCSAF